MRCNWIFELITLHREAELIGLMSLSFSLWLYLTLGIQPTQGSYASTLLRLGSRRACCVDFKQCQGEHGSVLLPVSPCMMWWLAFHVRRDS